jgi:hypothetical protein
MSTAIFNTGDLNRSQLIPHVEGWTIYDLEGRTLRATKIGREISRRRPHSQRIPCLRELGARLEKLSEFEDCASQAGKAPRLSGLPVWSKVEIISWCT